MFTLLLVVFGATQVFGQRIYDNVPNPLPGNLPSVGFEATGTSEFGDRITFAPATGRTATTVVQTMSSWACESGSWNGGNCTTTPGATFSHPITLNIYDVNLDGTPGTKIGTKTQTFAIPYRPSVDLIHCTGGKWYDATSATCFNGFAVNLTFDVKSLNLTLPDEVIYGIAYNTSHYGYVPIGAAPCSLTTAGCGYDSLNVATADAVTVGENFNENDVYQYTLFDSCTDGPVIPFGRDGECWGGLLPATQFNAANAPANQNDCKSGGWRTRTTAGGASFPNQGQCIQYVNTGK
jgi:hypothetical protein